MNQNYVILNPIFLCQEWENMFWETVIQNNYLYVQWD